MQSWLLAVVSKFQPKSSPRNQGQGKLELVSPSFAGSQSIPVPWKGCFSFV